MAKERKEKVPNFTAEQTAAIVESYKTLKAEGKTNPEAIAEIAEATNRKPRSVISKLSREGVYTVDEKTVKAEKEDGPSKKELLATLESTGFDVTGLDGATKDAIKRVIDAVTDSEDEKVSVAA